MRLQAYLLTLLPLRVAADNADGPTVDLLYARYKGTYNSTLNLNTFRGIRYANPPTGGLRWQPPEEPEDSSSNKNDNTRNKTVIPATSNPPHCPWSRRSLRYPKTANEEASLASFDFIGDEDCLFLNVFAPAGAKDLPVVVWIHGGGYNLDSAANYDFSTQIATNKNKYLAVVVQYRLGAFGFLSSANVVANGVANAGLHDMLLALRWVQKHICKFGGNPDKVTVAGHSAGGGAVLLLATTDEAEGLFDGVIASSPYLTNQPQFDSDRSTKAYYKLAERVGCWSSNESSPLFSCMQNVDSIALQNASDWVSTQSLYGHWEWAPVIDGKLLTSLASRLLGSRRQGSVKGVRLLTSNVADEGPYFTWQNITSRATFLSFLMACYPKLTATNVTEVLAVYTQKHEDFLMVNSNDVNNTDPGFDTDGRNAPYATTMSNYAMGWQQVANNFYAEATFVCPSYWLADAYAAKAGATAWRYQFSASPAYHGFDVGSGSDYDILLAPVDTPNSSVPRSLRRALQTAWGDFIVNGAPTLRDTDSSTTFWPQWKERGTGVASMLNVNVTGGVLVENDSSFDGMVTLHITSHMAGDSGAPPLQAVFEVANGDAWEEGRGKRCSLLAELSPWMNEQSYIHD
ncbi:carboxylesterase [Colletotrichum falcatum]|nr:carboxylesterase [Colletotrichum falcatum]